MSLRFALPRSPCFARDPYYILPSPAPVRSGSGSGTFGSVPTATHPPAPARSYSGLLVVVDTWSKHILILGIICPCLRTSPVDLLPFLGLLLGQLVGSCHIYSPLSPLAHSCLVRFVYPLHLHPSAPVFLPFYLCSSLASSVFLCRCRGPSLPEQNR